MLRRVGCLAWNKSVFCALNIFWFVCDGRNRLCFRVFYTAS